MSSTPEASHSVKQVVVPAAASGSMASALSSKCSTPLSPGSPQSLSHDSPQPSTATSASTPSTNQAGKPQLAIKPVAPGVRPLQKVAPIAAQGVNVMSMNSVVSPMPQSPAALSPASAVGKPPMSITSKEWVIPPRPKPGRKPATDTPPTKRKAQNRAAQRAFRERRAARVGELEDQLEEQKAEHQQTDREYQEKIRGLETEVQVLRSRCQMLETLLEKEKTNQPWSKERRESTPQMAMRNSMSRNSIQQHIISPVPQKPLHSSSQPRGSTSSSMSSASGRRSSAQPFSISQIISPPDEADDLTCGSCNPGDNCACAEEVIAATSGMDCGKCTLGSKCECLEETLRAFGEGSSSSNDLKRSLSSASPSILAPDEKKVRLNSRHSSTTEIDFTNMFSKPKPSSTRTPLPSMPIQQSRPPPPPSMPIQQSRPPPPVIHEEIPLKDKCGFCSDGTYCVCADTMPGVTMTGLSSGAVIAQQKTPPPSENDGPPPPLEVTATGAIKLSSFRRNQQSNIRDNSSAPSGARSSCGPGGPGTCAQCLADPVSGLFCRSLAANFERQGDDSEKPSGCCGGGGAGGCCKSRNAGSGVAAPVPKEPAKTNISLSCADAFKTLASHRHFDEATDEIGTWLPMLKAAPRHEPSKPAARHPMEVEAASIMSVLKGFDVRFGK